MQFHRILEAISGLFGKTAQDDGVHGGRDSRYDQVGSRRGQSLVHLDQNVNILMDKRRKPGIEQEQDHP